MGVHCKENGFWKSQDFILQHPAVGIISHLRSAGIREPTWRLIWFSYHFNGKINFQQLEFLYKKTG